jgi:hypothetical protein
MALHLLSLVLQSLLAAESKAGQADGKILKSSELICEGPAHAVKIALEISLSPLETISGIEPIGLK